MSEAAWERAAVTWAETSVEMLGPPARAQLLKCQRLAFPHFSFPEFYKNAKTVGWYLRTEGEGYCRLATDLEISVPRHKSTRCHFQLYERICYERDTVPTVTLEATFSPAALFPQLPLNLLVLCSTANSPCVEFDVHSRGEEHLACDRQ